MKNDFSWTGWRKGFILGQEAKRMSKKKFPPQYNLFSCQDYLSAAGGSFLNTKSVKTEWRTLLFLLFRTIFWACSKPKNPLDRILHPATIRFLDYHRSQENPTIDPLTFWSAVWNQFSEWEESDHVRKPETLFVPVLPCAPDDHRLPASARPYPITSQRVSSELATALV